MANLSIIELFCSCICHQLFLHEPLNNILRHTVFLISVHEPLRNTKFLSNPYIFIHNNSQQSPKDRSIRIPGTSKKQKKQNDKKKKETIHCGRSIFMNLQICNQTNLLSIQCHINHLQN